MKGVERVLIKKMEPGAVSKMTLGLLLIVCLNFCCQGQSIELKYMEFVNHQVVIHYDIMDSVEGRSYAIRLYSSADGFLNPLEKISGDAGLEVKSGKNKKILWTPGEELGVSFEGKVALEIRGRLFIPFINTESIDKYKSYKRSRKYNLTWSGGTPQNVLNFDLMRGDKKVATFPNLSNVGHSSFEFPVYLRPGKNYKFRISDAKNKDEVVFTQPFQIKRKVPFLIKIIPVLAIGSVTYLIVSSSKSTAGEPVIGDPIVPSK